MCVSKQIGLSDEDWQGEPCGKQQGLLMNWIPLTTENQLETIKEASETETVVIFKHSTRCSISAVAKSRLDRAETPENMTFYYLDLIKYRKISDEIAAAYGVEHESPQVLLIKNGKCVYDESHSAIAMDELVSHAN
ncbi:bacillithiol system redox-active protein YtxJ [Chitinophaga sancti]|uniref:bacillithiol system redox-active protein YtxJ n=1 Tax=Chitinophaga sancti TaxID=1004 RepID=UPI003F7A582C